MLGQKSSDSALTSRLPPGERKGDITVKIGLLTGERTKRKVIPPASWDSVALASVSAKKPPCPLGR